MRATNLPRLGGWVVGLWLYCAAGGAWADNRVWVGTDGTDSSSCGASGKPCRSISQAIENAVAGDVIWVGPGHYGDLSGTGTYTGPGDEHASLKILIGGGCVVCIDKPITIYSVSGAAVTLIDGNPATAYNATVAILADDVVFGSPGHGFTLAGGNEIGVLVDFNADGVPKKNIRIDSDVDVGDQNGFVFRGSVVGVFGCPPGPECLPTSQVLFTNDVATANPGVGFMATANRDFGPGRVIFQQNLASGCGTGYLVNTGDQGEGNIDPDSAGIVQLTGNVASHCGVGFNTLLPGTLYGNTAAYNAQSGFVLVPSRGQAFQNNSAIGNSGPGVLVDFSTDATVISVGFFSHFTRNNFFGNDRARPAALAFLVQITAPFSLPAGFPGSSAHCGVLNVGGTAALVGPEAVSPPPAQIIVAAFNYWGTNHGPTAMGSGDAAGGVCDLNGGQTITSQYSTTAWPVTSFP